MYLSNLVHARRARLLLFPYVFTVALAHGQTTTDTANVLIEEVTVSAQRREESNQRVPLAISVYSNSELDKNDISDVSALSLVAPGLMVTSAGSDARATLRGVPTPSVQLEADPSLGFHVDGVYQARAPQALAALFDVARVEVQRGPQGTLFGRNTTGGNISIITQGPMDSFGGYVNADVGNYGAWKVGGAINIPLSDSLQVRLAAQHQEHDPYADNLAVPGSGANAQDQDVGRFSARWKPSDWFDAVLKVSAVEESGPRAGFNAYKIVGTQIDPVTGVASPTGVIRYDINPISPTRPNSTDPLKFSADAPFFHDLSGVGSSLRLNFELPFARLTTLTGYDHMSVNRGGDFDYSDLPLRTIEFLTRSNAISQEVQLASLDTEPLSWVFGLFYFKEDAFENFELRYQPPFVPANFHLDRESNATNKSQAAFGQISYFFLPKLRATIGGRYTVDDKEFAVLQRVNGGTALDIDLSDEFSKFTGRAGVDYFVRDDSMLFASVSTGFRSGGFNRTDGTNPQIPFSYDPEEAISYEVGLKSRLFDGRAQLNASVFVAEYDNAHVGQIDNATITPYTRNAGEVKARGVEVESIMVPLDDLQVSFTGQYIDAYYSKFQGCLDNFFNMVRDCSDNQIGQSPKWKFSLGVAYDIQLGAAGTLTPYVLSSYSDPYYTEALNLEIGRVKSFTKTDFRLRWAAADGSFTAEAYVENIEDKTVLTWGVAEWIASQQQGAFYGNYSVPRTYGARIGYKF